MFLLLPILIVISSGLTIFITTYVKNLEIFKVLTPIVQFIIHMTPYVFTWIMFIALYIFMPNTKVRFKYTIIPGILAGTTFQIFQFIYVNSQIWVSSYNAIYGSFAAIPMFLLWAQISWTICLFGAELCYISQNLSSLSFGKENANMSRRYHDFVAILMMSLIAKRFARGEKPYTAEEISEECQIPIRLTRRILDELEEVGLVHEVSTDEKSESLSYQPSIDINKLNAATLFDRLDTHGSEDFKIDKEHAYNGQWQMLMKAKEEYYSHAGQVLLKDL